jgi:molybdopterin synthase catalytic subunit
MDDRFAIHVGALPAGIVGAAALQGPACGAIASFIGVVRDRHHGRAVTALAYECHEPLAIGVLARLAGELRRRFGADVRLHVTHATGILVPGDAAVAIHAGAQHRRAALDACGEAIEALKRDLPVWKHERYVDGTTAWMEGS